MLLKNVLIIAILALNFVVFGQTDSTNTEKRIFLKNKTKEINSNCISKWDQVKIWLKEVDKPIKGYVTYLSDTTLSINEEVIAIKDIEEIRITPPGGKFIGTVLITLGGTAAVGGLYIMSEAEGAYGSGGVFLFLMGAAGVIVGVPIASAGVVLLVLDSKKYDLDEWEIQFENKKH
ncbi:MAG: hypothetical protein GQ574_15995 [Crocinitomix sp.]|nr:hypothetical protein [Crocinitomix sp.]